MESRETGTTETGRKGGREGEGEDGQVKRVQQYHVSVCIVGALAVVNTSHHTISGVVPIIMSWQVSSPVNPVILQHGTETVDTSFASN